ncbi:MAG: lipid-binding SYLF domain-containing protein, partial [Verrucomicrobiae bacterium]|nr:lipid-binding SYLF domain-containing protein [Verrucomicrobiae bacterium]
MKTKRISTAVKHGLVPAMLAMGLAVTAFAQSQSKLDNRVRKLMAQFEALQADSEARIPAEKLNKAKGVILMERTKGGFIVGYEQGFGVAMVKGDDGWSPFAFMNSHEGSFGAQIGGKSTFSVILLMNDAARDRLVNPKVSFGGEAAGTGGSSTGGVGDSFTQEPPVLVFGQAKGLYGGAVVKGGSVAADDKANENYYGRFYSTKDILFDGKVEAPETAREFG